MTTKKEMERLHQRLSALEEEVAALRAQQQSTPPRTHGLAEAAKVLGKTPYWLRNACRTGVINEQHFTRVGQTLRFTDDHIRKIIADFEGRPYSEARAPLAA
ncbi:hypothetical protein [Streptomyces klenkii]|uniref:hypothetical protein n=1 Tax=Streptomyces klenkii TaxID=1420899 RepID=UPI001F5475DE|nr:hypothetical protein [Streptomyces klenkii]